MVDSLGAQKLADLQSAWCELISGEHYRWDEFVTATFRIPQHDDDRAHAMFDSWLTRRYFDEAFRQGDVHKELGKPREDAYGRPRPGSGRPRFVGSFERRWKKKRGRPAYVLGIEKTQRGDNHLHAVVAHKSYRDTIRRDRGWSIWHDQMNLGRIRIEPPTSQGSVVGYVTKYVIKNVDTVRISGLNPALPVAR